MRVARMERLERRRLLSASMLEDLNLNTDGSNPAELTAFQGEVYFRAGTMLWRSDGTAAGTTQVAGDPGWPNQMAAAGTRLFVSTPAGLWATDGNSGVLVESSPNPIDLTADGNELFFVQPDAAGGTVWKSDGTVAGTGPVLATGSPVRPDSLCVVNGTLFFHASDSQHGDELWKTDGTAAGTVLVKDILPGPTGSTISSLIDISGTLYFVADDGVHGLELWKSDGTAAGTVILDDINPGPAGSAPSQLTDVNGVLFFTANDGLHGYQLWQSNGTAAGTAMVANINPGGPGGGLTNLTAVGSTLFFDAFDPQHGQELWKSDGTPAGTAMVDDINPGPAGSAPSFLTNVNGTLYFQADDGTHGGGLWKSDRTAAGTVMVQAFLPDSLQATISDLANVNGTLYFSADDVSHGQELWKSDGTAAGTVLVDDINTITASSNTSSVVDVNGIGFFSGTDGIHGQELWKTDGTAAGTVMVKDIVPGAVSSNPTDLVMLNGALYFVASGQLWKSDGTDAGTVRVSTAAAGIDELTVSSKNLFFRGSGAGGYGLWVSDGTSVGTQLLKSGFAPNTLDDLTAVGGDLFFAADDGANGDELWTSDGTPAGTNIVADINPGPDGSNPYYITDVNGTAFFVATDGQHGYQLWRSDGTALNTVMVDDINYGGGDANINNLCAVNNALFFSADDGTNGQELWWSDGYRTYMLKDINAGPGGSDPTGLTAVDGLCFFRATTTDGAELWTSDGTSINTIEVKDINSGPGSSWPRQLTAVGNELAFVASDGGAATVWESDGTPAGTVPVDSVVPYGGPSNLSGVATTLYFTAADAQHGATLWSAVLPQPGVAAVAPALKASPPSESPSPSTSTKAVSLASTPPLLPSAFAFDASNSYNQPNLSGPQTPQIYVGYLNDIYPGANEGGLDLTAPDQTLVRALADRAARANEPLVIDLENLSDDGRGVSPGQVHASIEQLIEIADWAHLEQPDLKLGFYGNVPPGYGGSPAPSQQYNAWLAAAQLTAPVIDHVDFICPVLYANSPDPSGWNYSPDTMLQWSVQFGKPVLPFLSMNYSQDGQNGIIAYQPLPAEQFQAELQKVEAAGLTPIIWGGFPNDWSDNQPWWAVLRETIAEADSPTATITVTDPPGQPPVDQATIAFSQPVPGLTISGLSLTRDGGPNLLGPGQSLTSSDGGKTWQLSGLSPITSAGGQFALSLKLDGSVRTPAGYVPLSANIVSWNTAEVVGRHIFYDDSAFDGNDPSISSADDNAIAPDKQALLPDLRATFANYTSYSMGINGIMVDMRGLTGTPAAADFVFRVGNDNNPGAWAAAPAPSALVVRKGAGAGGSDRIEITWPNGAIKNEWLQVTVQADANTGLSMPDVFYFGNAIGSSGDTPSSAQVTSADVAGARNDPHGLSNPAPITNVHDYNRDGKVDAADQLIALLNQTTPTTALQLIGHSGFSDLVLVARNYGHFATFEQGDFTGDGKVDFRDLVIVARSYGPTATGGAAAALLPQLSAANGLSPDLQRRLRLAQALNL